MTPVERKIVHEALKDDPEVETLERGVGAEPVRRRAAAAHRGLSDGRVPRALARGGARDAGCDRSRRSRRRATRSARRRASCHARCSSAFPEPWSTSARVAELPGIPLAAVFPERSFTLLEAERRKCDFLERVTSSLDNVAVVWGRAEEQTTGHVRRRSREGARQAARRRRALPPARRAGRCRDPLARRVGRSRRGRVRLRRSSALGSRRTLDGLVVLRKLGPTPAGFPRRPGIAKKRPLA